MSENGLFEGFITDEMLKKLGRFLRIAGFDVGMPAGLEDSEIADMAKRGNRILLTRDKDLSAMKGPCSLRVYSDDISDQMKELNDSCIFEKVKRNNTRCPACGMVLRRIDNSEEICEMNIPPLVKERQDVIYHCPDCSKNYWRGKHWDNIMRVLGDASLEPLPY